MIRDIIKIVIIIMLCDRQHGYRDMAVIEHIATNWENAKPFGYLSGFLRYVVASEAAWPLIAEW